MLIRSSVWLDARGYTRISLIRSNTGAGGIEAAIQASVNAGLLECWEGPQTLSVPAPAAATYESGLQIARLAYLCGDGTVAVLLLPAPKLAIMLADQVTVDSSNALVAAITAAAVGHLESASGSLAVSYLSGTLGPRPEGAG